MNPAVEPRVPGSTSIFESSCAYCGALFRVLAARGAQADHAEEYACPECGKHYETRAAAEPQVRLLKPRRDGKRDRYQETLF
ncbi:MAG TPA: hypothetical protein VLK85_17245 [Ramlibacter sp.]|nr:hypothetical protein [Ramlibacter sp.]